MSKQTSKTGLSNVLGSDINPSTEDKQDDVVFNSGGGVPTTYTKSTQSSEQFNVVKGELNKFRLRPQISNEHAESSREVMDVVDSTTVVGQIFKASQDNINGVHLTLQSAATFVSMDTITAGLGENKSGTIEYTSDVALQAEYIKSGATEAIRSAFTDLGGTTQDGSFALKAPMDTLNDSWTVTLTSTDLTGVTFSVRFSQTKDFNKAKCYFFIGDGTNTKSIPLSIGAKNVWQTFQFAETSMVDDGATTPDMTAITKFGFKIIDADGGEFFYADSITYQAEGGTFNLELWDMGASLPASNGTVDYTTGTQYTELGDRGINGTVVSSVSVELLGGKRLYHIHNFVAGVAKEIASNTLLTVDNYYALVLKYVDTDVSVFGPDTTQSTKYYTNGYAWKAETADNLIDKIQGASGSGAYSDLMFQIMSTQDVYITRTDMMADSAPGSSVEVSIFAEDSSMGITDIATVHQEGGMGQTKLSFDNSIRPIYLEKGGKFEAYYDDDPTDSTTLISFSMNYLYIPPTTNN